MKIRRRDAISAEEEAAIRAAVGPARTVAADEVLIRRGVELTASTMLLEGMLCRRKDLRGGRRQISALHVPGDFADLHSLTLRRLEHDIVSLTRCRIAEVPHDALRAITELYPHLTRVFWFSTNLDAAIHREWMMSIGRRSAIGRVAHLLCELCTRLGIVGLADGSSFDFPLTQPELSECVGLTPVHINRTLQELRRRELVDIGNRRVTIRDWDALARIADFNPDYLYLERMPR